MMNNRTRLPLAGVGVAALALSLFPGERAQQCAPLAAAPAPQRAPLPLQLLPPPPPAPGDGAAAAAHPVYLDGQLMVAAGAPLAELAADYGAAVLRPAGPSGYGVLGVDEVDRASLERALAKDPRVRAVSRNARVRGAASGSGGSGGRASAAQWHLDDVGAPYPGELDMSAWTVAVLDSGVAINSGGGLAVAASLAGNPVVAPWDFVEGDDVPQDEHWHGTHIASIIGSQGDVEGVAPGVGIMPVRVLGARNEGDEAALIDGIVWAVDGGADVINMSLSFAPGYQPSQALSDAIGYAHDAGVILVAAAGNDGEQRVSWPAASPQVLAVGAADAAQRLVGYSNSGLLVDLLAPGGDVDRDDNGDGWPDGILAETIVPGDPGKTGLYFASGTSQAAAVVSGAVVSLLKRGATPAQITAALQAGGRVDSSGAVRGGFSRGTGGGVLALSGAIDQLAGRLEGFDMPTYGAAVLPWIQRSGDEVRPVALLTVVDESGTPGAVGLEVGVTLWSEGAPTALTCTLDSQGQCSVAGAWLRAPAEDMPAAAWAFEVSAILDRELTSQEIAYRPDAVFFASDSLEVLAAGLDGSGLSSSPLGLIWSEGPDDHLGELAAGVTVVNTGSGLSSSPLGLVATLPTFDGALGGTVDVDLDGSGLSSSPLGFVTLQLLNGQGLSSSPLGFSLPVMVLVDGSGLSSSPLGFHALSLLSGMSDGLALGKGTLDGTAVWLSDGWSGGALDGTTLGEIVDSGAWLTDDGCGAASALTASAAVDVGLEAWEGDLDAGASTAPLAWEGGSSGGGKGSKK
jgi:hypothetical protein